MVQVPAITDAPFNASPTNAPARNSQAIRAVIEFLRQRAGGSVYVPDERFEIDSPIVIPEFVNFFSGVSFWGKSRRAAIVAAAGFPQRDANGQPTSIFRCEGAGCKFEGFALEGQNQPVRGLTFTQFHDGFNQNSAQNMYFGGFGGSAIVGDGAWNLHVVNCGFLMPSDAWCIEILWNGTNSLIAGNDMQGGQGIAIRKPQDRQQNEGTIIDDNQILSTQGCGVLIEGGLEIYVTNNVIDQIGTAGLRAPSRARGLAGLKVTGNWMVGGVDKPAAEFEGDCFDLLFVNNTVQNGCIVSFNGELGGGIHRPVINSNRFLGTVPHNWEQVLALQIFGGRSSSNFGTGRIYVGDNCVDWLSVGDTFDAASHWGPARRV